MPLLSVWMALRMGGSVSVGNFTAMPSVSANLFRCLNQALTVDDGTNDLVNFALTSIIIACEALGGDRGDCSGLEGPLLEARSDGASSACSAKDAAVAGQYHLNGITAWVSRDIRTSSASWT